MATTRAIELVTAVPGPRSQEIIARKERVVAAPLSLLHDIVIESGQGTILRDVDGNSFLDFAGGIGCLAVGHSHPRVVEAVKEQAERFLHTDFTVVPYEPYVELAERLLAIAPFSGPGKAAFFNAGTEAIENAAKFARTYTKRPALIAFEGGFHGRTLLSMTLTSKAQPYKAGLGPLAPEVYRLPFPDEFRGPSTEQAIAALERGLVAQVDPEHVAAIFVEAVQGEGGFRSAPAEFLRALRRICDEHGIVLVADEVQTGFGRTAKMFAFEHSGVEPDLVALAKSIASGLPLSAVIGRAEIMDAPADSAIGGTYVGNPVALVAALAVLDVFEEEDLLSRAEAIGATMRERMLGWQERWPAIGDVRGVGPMLALELVRPGSKEPAADLASAVVAEARRRGLLLLKAGLYSNCIRVLLPLVISDAELDEGLTVWEHSLETTLG